MLQRGDLLSDPALDYEGWRDALRPDWGRYNPEAMDPKAFTGRARPRSLCGFAAMDITGNAQRVERTQRDVRLDGLDHYYAVFQVAGASTMIQNDRAVKLAVGDAALVDSARPVTYVPGKTYVSENMYGQWFSLKLPRRSLVSHLGFEPQHGSGGRCDARAGRLLFQLVLDAVNDEESLSEPAGAYMRLGVYDLLGALFAPSDPMPVSLHTDKLFRRVCNIIEDRFSDPGLGPCEVAAEAGISLRYLQKLFTAHNSTCSHFIHLVRLDHAVRLLHRRKSLGTGQPLSEIAYACGFGDYTNFARRFRRRFGHTPGSHSREGA
jgi:AraC family transcriptional regulator, positive regulator of tynA and feaB